MTTKTTAGVAEALFFLVFPAFFLYQSLAAFAVMPPVIGGGFTAAQLLALAALAPLLLLSVLSTWKLHLPVVFLGLAVVATATWFYLWGDHYQQNTGYFYRTLKVVGAWGGLYCIGLALRPTKHFRWLVLGSLVLMAAITPFLVQTPPMSLDPYERAGWGVASRQFFATAFALPAIFALALAWRSRWEVPVIAISLVSVFFLLSRSEQLGLFAVAFGWACLCAIHGRWKSIGTAALASVALFAVAFYAASFVTFKVETPPWVVEARRVDKGTREGLAQNGPKSATGSVMKRAMDTLDLEQSKSASERSKLLRAGIDDIWRSPILGDYAGQIRDTGKAGTYIHNILSVWRQYGLLPFLIYLAMNVATVVLSIRELVWRKSEDRLWLLTGMVGGYSLLLMLVAKSVFWPVPALAWGLLMARLMERRA